MQEIIIEAQQINPAQRHAFIFQQFDGLEGGASVVIVNNHDPVPLLRQFEQLRAGEFQHDYLEQGPQVWKLRLTKIKKEGCCCFCGG